MESQSSVAPGPSEHQSPSTILEMRQVPTLHFDLREVNVISCLVELWSLPVEGNLDVI